jgi:hypothetical protein
MPLDLNGNSTPAPQGHVGMTYQRRLREVIGPIIKFLLILAILITAIYFGFKEAQPIKTMIIKKTVPDYQPGSI